ncbi:uncharacterized protein LOC116094709 [Mastomys coucha]|uniref:uncharacterized protein LOC116094709 n=1 Tax=Mastomys coucha TaxID=35658 RepID=UPI001262164F|nr:uncharacterized protein LOC116094709 [Mastomys coucha]
MDKQLVVQDAFLTILSELSYFSWFIPITNMGTSAEGVEMMTLLALQVGPSLLHGGEDTSRLHNILSTSISPFDLSEEISLLEDGDGLPVDDKLPILSLDCAVEFAMGGDTPEHVDHVVEVNEGVVDGNNLHFAKSRAEGSPGNQASNTAKSVHTDLHHLVYRTRQALHKMWLSL